MKNNSTYPSIHSEGALLPMDLLERVAALEAELPGLKPLHYGLSRSERINEAINRSWSRLLPIWQSFREDYETLPDSDAGTTITREDWLAPLFQELGFGKLTLSKAEIIAGKSYAISHRRGEIPIHQISFRYDLDKRAERVAGASRVSPHTLMQEYLNRTENSLWGILTNGRQLRILRDSVMLSRQAYLEFDLEIMFNGDCFSDFRLLWLLCHESRFENGKECLLEQWTKFAVQSGARALDSLRDGVTNAIQSLGAGFLKNPANRELKQKLRSGQLDKQDYYRQLLRLIYRFLMLFVAEDRGTLWTAVDPETLARTEEAFGTRRLRDQSVHLRGTAHGDRWEALRVLFAQLSSDNGCPELGIPALGGFLFSPEAIPDLKDASLANRDLYAAVRSLSQTMDGKIRRPVNYAELGAEELGSIYESLLEMHPILDSDNGSFVLNVAAGNERKTTGSYYTPESLIRVLLDTALEPVVEDRLKGLKTKEEQEAALLSLRICDPACGSGHFLLGAARRLGERLASIRRDGDEPSPDDKRMALRDVIRSCIYGVDLNPMSVELCKVGLWMESMQPGLPLSFLDAHIRCGNSLVGMGPKQKIMDLQVPDNAFDPKTGDDKSVAAQVKKLNKQESSQYALSLFTNTSGVSSYFGSMYRFEEMPEDSVADVREKRKAWEAIEASEKFRLQKDIADLWISAFSWPLIRSNENLTFPTQGNLWNLQHGIPVNKKLIEKSHELSNQANAFHWPLMFPGIFSGLPDSGFDVVLGNPPYIQLQKEEIREQTDILQKMGYDTFARTGDIYCLFYERGNQMLHDNGYLGYITSNKWMRAGYGENLRRYLGEKTNPKLLLDFSGQKLFGDATVDCNILVFEKSENEGKTLACQVKTDSLDNLSVYITQNGGTNRFDSSESWTILSPIEISIKRKIESIGTPLKDWDIQIYRGILTGCNEAFIISGEKKDALIKEDPKSAEIIRPILRGRDIKRYGYDFADLWLINTHNGIKEKNIAPININHYPAIKRHLDHYYPVLEKRADKGITPYNLRNCAYMDDFSKQKIMYNDICQRLSFCLVPKDVLCVNTVYFIKDNAHLKYFLACLNTKIINWYYRTLSVQLGEKAVRMFSIYVEKIPVPIPTTEAERKINSLIDELSNSDHKTKNIIEIQIETIISNLYQLSDSEMKFISSLG